MDELEDGTLIGAGEVGDFLEGHLRGPARLGERFPVLVRGAK